MFLCLFLFYSYQTIIKFWQKNCKAFSLFFNNNIITLFWNKIENIILKLASSFLTLGRPRLKNVVLLKTVSKVTPYSQNSIPTTNSLILLLIENSVINFSHLVWHATPNYYLVSPPTTSSPTFPTSISSPSTCSRSNLNNTNYPRFSNSTDDLSQLESGVRWLNIYSSSDAASSRHERVQVDRAHNHLQYEFSRDRREAVCQQLVRPTKSHLATSKLWGFLAAWQDRINNKLIKSYLYYYLKIKIKKWSWIFTQCNVTI